MTLSNFAIVALSVTLSAIAQMFLKIGVSSVEHVTTDSVLTRVVAYLLSTQVLLGLVLYAVGAVIWLFALKQIDLSMAYPFVGMSFILVFFLGVMVLGEPFQINRLVGSLIIIAGLLVISYNPA